MLPLGCYVALFEFPMLHDPQIYRGGQDGAPRWPCMNGECRACDAGHPCELTSPFLIRLWLLILLSGIVSFFLNLANFLVTKYTSPVALQASHPRFTRDTTVLVQR